MPEHYNAGDRMPEGVLLLDRDTGLPVPTLAQGLTDAQLRATAVPVSLAATPGLTDAQLRATALPTTDSLGGTRTHNTAGGIRQAVGAVSARVALPTLGTSREMYVMATQRCFFLTGDSSVTAVNTTGLTNTSHPLAADERFYFRVPAGHTHIAYIRESVDGFITIMPVA